MQSIYFRVLMHQSAAVMERFKLVTCDETQTTKWGSRLHVVMRCWLLTAGCTAPVHGSGPRDAWPRARVPSAGGRAGSSVTVLRRGLRTTSNSPAAGSGAVTTADRGPRPGNSSVDSRASNECSRRFHNHGEGPKPLLGPSHGWKRPLLALPHLRHY